MPTNYRLRLTHFFIILAFIFSAWKATANSTHRNYSLYYFAASVQNNTVEVEWKTTPDMSYSAFVVQYSKEGFVFDTLAVVVPSAQDTADYTYIHLSPASGANYYRLGMVDLNGTIHFSAIADVTLEEKKPGQPFELLQIFPVPATDELNFTVNCSKASNLSVQVLSGNGKTVVNEKIYSYTGSEVHQLDCRELVSGNLYTLLVTDENGFRQFRHILKK
jgi:hypothetical protein